MWRIRGIGSGKAGSAEETGKGKGRLGKAWQAGILDVRILCYNGIIGQGPLEDRG